MIVCLMGPTATGKTDLALELCDRLPFDIISVDSAMIYRGMDIGTAKPSLEIQKKYPHKLIDIRDPKEAYSVGEFRKDCLIEIDKIIKNNRVPLLVGGTMLYFNKLQHGLAELPSADAKIRTEITERATKLGWQALHQELQKIDSETAKRLQPTDSQRIQRALEVFYLTGKTLSQWLTETKPTDILPYKIINIALLPDNRELLHQKIALRFQQMLDQGFVEEVEKLYRRGDLHPDLPSIRAVGYRQMWDFLSNNLSYEEMTERGIIATRQLAKRQITWLRMKTWQNLQVFTSEDPHRLGTISQFLSEKLGF